MEQVHELFAGFIQSYGLVLQYATLGRNLLFLVLDSLCALSCPVTRQDSFARR